MSIYRYPHLTKSSWPIPLNQGLIPGTNHIARINQGAKVLSDFRWSATFAYHAGAKFSSAEVAFFCPMSGTGRWQCQVVVQSTTSSITISDIAIKRMDNSSTYTYWSGTYSSMTNPTDLTSASGGTFRTGARMYPGNTTYGLITNGASRVAVRGLSGSGPLGVSIIGFPDSQYSTGTSSGLSGWRNDGSFTPGWPDYALTPLTAGWARAIEAEIEVGETMPIPIGVLPINVTGVTAFEANWSNNTIRRAMTKQVPLAPSLRPKALFIAVGLPASTSLPTIKYQVGQQRIDAWETVYHSGNYTVLKARLYDLAYYSWVDSGGVPIVNCEMLSFYGGNSDVCSGMTVWIGEDF